MEGVGDSFQPPELNPVAGLRLPRSRKDWEAAHAYFHAYPPLPPHITDLDGATAQFQHSIYHYFQSTFGEQKPKQASGPPATNAAVRAIRRQLKELKVNNAPVDVLKRMSANLRHTLKAKLINNNNNSNYFNRAASFSYKSNPWKYMNEIKKIALFRK